MALLKKKSKGDDAPKAEKPKKEKKEKKGKKDAASKGAKKAPSSIGMTLPGQVRRTQAKPNVYTALALAACVALLAAVVIVGRAGTMVNTSEDGPLSAVKLAE